MYAQHIFTSSRVQAKRKPPTLSFSTMPIRTIIADTIIAGKCEELAEHYNIQLRDLTADNNTSRMLV